MKKIYSVLVENRSGVLCKVSGLFSRRSFNIDSLAVGETDDPTTSCMTIVSSGDERTLEQIEKQLRKLEDVRDIMETCEIMKAQIVDMSKKTMIIQICDVPERIQLFIGMMQSISIVEVARTGTLALQKCLETDN